jgi:hypothetical protein
MPLYVHSIRIARYSLSYIDTPKCLKHKALLKKTNGLPYWLIIAPIPIAETSISSIKVFLKLGNANDMFWRQSYQCQQYASLLGDNLTLSLVLRNFMIFIAHLSSHILMELKTCSLWLTHLPTCSLHKPLVLSFFLTNNIGEANELLLSWIIPLSISFTNLSISFLCIKELL